jgi:hypothetical protein
MNRILFAIAVVLAALFVLENRYYYFHQQTVVFRVDRIRNTLEMKTPEAEGWSLYERKQFFAPAPSAPGR